MLNRLKELFCRRCPGRHFAEDSVWLVMASVLAEFDITYAKDKDGKDIIPAEKFISSLVRWVLSLFRLRILLNLTVNDFSRPEPFEAHFSPRHNT